MTVFDTTCTITKILIDGGDLGVSVPANVKSVVESATDENESAHETSIEAGGSTIQIVNSFFELAGKSFPIGDIVDPVLLVKHLNDAKEEFDATGSLSNSTLMDLDADVMGVITGSLLVVGGTASAPYVGAATVTGALLTATGLLQSSGDSSIFDYWADFAGDLSDSLGEAREDVAKFFEDVGQGVKDGVSGGVDGATEAIPAGIEAVAGLMERAGDALGDFVKGLGDDISDGISDLFDSAQSAVQRRDPLTLDLDGDGLETVGIDPVNPILFDHDGDGIKTATGWIKPDDAFLVMDRNDNGTIDNGTELFGDSTPLMDGEGNEVGTAEDGFAALAQEDTNGDGVVDANDANFADLRVWRDLNSDGVSQADELQSLDEAEIAAINVAKTENSQPLADMKYYSFLYCPEERGVLDHGLGAGTG
ncbi:MAG: hypothetical protein OEY01_16730 [Desulfobulbaceae bacterium]|nr:hypothetical protein [Desulfobulbaceae bacterium]